MGASGARAPRGGRGCLVCREALLNWSRIDLGGDGGKEKCVNAEEAPGIDQVQPTSPYFALH